MNKKSIVFVIVGLLLITIFYFTLKIKYQRTASSTEISTVATSSQSDLIQIDASRYHTYSNTEFSFQFKYPSSFPEMKSSDEKKCGNGESWNGAAIKSLPLANADNLSISVVCEALNAGLVHQFVKESGYKYKELNVNGKKVYTHYFVTATGYEWRVLQVQIDSSHYLEVGYTYRYLPDYEPISEIQWNSLVSSVSFK
jgi:hypothetical protein